MERIAMSQEERDWLDWLKRARDGQVTQKWAAEKMGVSDRWVRSLLAEMKVKGDAVVVHGLRGRRSNRRIDEEIRARAMEIVKSPDWHDFKPTFAAEQLAKRHQIQASKETVRQWMIAEGIWQSKGRKLKEVHRGGRGEPLRRVGAVGHFRPRLAGRTRRAGASPGADDRRCHQPELGTFRASDGRARTWACCGNM